jgi:hypothetical protein
MNPSITAAISRIDEDRWTAIRIDGLAAGHGRSPWCALEPITGPLFFESADAA